MASDPFKFSFEIKSRDAIRFFDEQEVVDLIGQEAADVMRRGGAMVASIARRSIKRRKWRKITGKKGSDRVKEKVAEAFRDPRFFMHEYANWKVMKSNPGDPPYAHTGKTQFGIKNIIFGYDDSNDTVIVGPIGGGAQDIPKVLEFGGTTRARKVPAWAKRARSFWGGPGMHQQRIQARPYMRPALDTFKSVYPLLYRDMLVGRKLAKATRSGKL